MCGRLGVCSLCLPVGIEAWTNTVHARPSLPTRAVLDRASNTPWVTAGPGQSPTEAQIKPSPSSFTPLLFSGHAQVPDRSACTQPAGPSMVISELHDSAAITTQAPRRRRSTAVASRLSSLDPCVLLPVVVVNRTP